MPYDITLHLDTPQKVAAVALAADLLGGQALESGPGTAEALGCILARLSAHLDELMVGNPAAFKDIAACCHTIALRISEAQPGGQLDFDCPDAPDFIDGGLLLEDWARLKAVREQFTVRVVNTIGRCDFFVYRPHGKGYLCRRTMPGEKAVPARLQMLTNLLASGGHVSIPYLGEKGEAELWRVFQEHPGIFARRQRDGEDGGEA